jgi:alkaline phosphatase
MTAGDNVNMWHATLRNYHDCYGPTWGRFRGRTRPVPGNHDYTTPKARDYFAYFGRRAGPKGRGYYAFDAGAWRIYALDSNCAIGRRCRKGSAQYRWLQSDLSKHPRACVMAVWHHPLFSSGRPDHDRIRPLVRLLHGAGAEIIVNAHHHLYERFAPARPSGAVDREHGLRQFIVGTGGAPHSSFGQGRWPHSQRRTSRTHGVLKLALGSEGYTWRFLRARGRPFDYRGEGTFHEPPP